MPLNVLLTAALPAWFERFERDVVHAFTCTWYGPVLEGVSRAVESKLLGAGLVVLALGGLALRDGRTACRALLVAGAGFGLAMLLASVLWATIDRARPPEAFGAVLRGEAELATCAAHPEALALRSGGSTSPSFPSRHALTVGVCVSVLGLARRWLGLVAAVYGLAVCVQRLTSGKHWPSDLAAGLVLGLLIGWLCWRGYPPLARRLGLPLGPLPPAPPVPPAPVRRPG